MQSQRAYKDKDGNFQHTTSFKDNDIPKAVLALTKAYDYLVSRRRGSDSSLLPVIVGTRFYRQRPI